MSRLRANELRHLSREELFQKRDTMTQELVQLRLRARVVGTERPMEFRRLRRDIARVLTVLRESAT